MSAGTTLKKAKKKSEFSCLSNFTVAVGVQMFEVEFAGLLPAAGAVLQLP